MNLYYSHIIIIIMNKALYYNYSTMGQQIKQWDLLGTDRVGRSTPILKIVKTLACDKK